MTTTESTVRRGAATRNVPPADRAPQQRRRPPAVRPRPERIVPGGRRVKRTEPRVAAPAPGEAAGRQVDTRRAPFVLLVVGLLCGGLVSLLLLNTVLAQDSFRANGLQRSNQQLRQEAEEQRARIAQLGGPEVLHQQATELGERPDESAPQILTPAPKAGGRTNG